MSTPAPARTETLTVRSIIEMLAASLGWEKSADVVNATVARLGFPPVLITPEQAFALLAELAKAPGMVGVTARFAGSRLESSRPPSLSSRASFASTSMGDALPVSFVQKVPRVLLLGEIAELLASTVGQERADEAVREVVQRLAFPANALTREQTLALLDAIAVRPGLLGMTARFAKTRAIQLFEA
jgi:hypothetical protein